LDAIEVDELDLIERQHPGARENGDAVSQTLLTFAFDTRPVIGDGKGSPGEPSGAGDRWCPGGYHLRQPAAFTMTSTLRL
jgi:hypothetical protein